MDSSSYTSKMTGHKRVDHAAEGVRIIDEFFKTDSEMSEEAKLWEGLNRAVERNWMSLEEANQCFQAFRDSHDPLATPIRPVTDWPEPPEAA